jgi:hypothetical protein
LVSHLSKAGRTPSQFLNGADGQFLRTRMLTYRKAGEVLATDRTLAAALHIASVMLARMRSGNERWILSTEIKQLANDIAFIVKSKQTVNAAAQAAPQGAGAGAGASASIPRAVKAASDEEWAAWTARVADLSRPRTAPKAAGKAAGKPDGKAAGKPDGKAAGKPDGKPAGKPDGKPAGKAGSA